jgi:alanine racemase
MGRSGAIPDDAPELVAAIRRSPSLQLAGVFTHFAASDAADKAHAHGQAQRFADLLASLGPWEGVLRHAANSAAVSDLPQTHLDMVRPGVAIYGYQASDELLRPMDLRPCLRLTAPIVQVKTLPAGWTCGYGCTVKLDRPRRVGIVAAGYNDGVSRALSGRCPVGVGGAMAPVLGRVSMDQLIVDLTDAPSAQVGDRAELISPDPAAANSVENLARLGGTIPYEVTCRLGRRTAYRLVETF